MCKKESSSITTNFHVLRGITIVEDKVLKVKFGCYCSRNEVASKLGTTATDFLLTVMPKALENFKYIPKEIHYVDNIRSISKGVQIEQARKADVEKEIDVLKSVIDTCESGLKDKEFCDKTGFKVKTLAMLTDYKAELDWNLELLKALEERENVCVA